MANIILIVKDEALSAQQIAARADSEYWIPSIAFAVFIILMYTALSTNKSKKK